MLIYAINVLPVVLAAFSTMVIGMLWYSPVMFGTKWMQLVGMTAEMTPEAKKRAKFAYVFMAISAVVMAYVLALFIENMFVLSMNGALTIALFAWVGFVATSMTGEYLFNAKPKPWALYILNSGYYLVALLANAIIIFTFIK
ncbi:MAG: DUF1761 domain-containing protein [Patescibacteria group bacterium]